VNKIEPTIPPAIPTRKVIRRDLLALDISEFQFL